MNSKKNPQQQLFEFKKQLAYGGDLRKKAKNRGARPLSFKHSMHMVLRSSRAKGDLSFRHAKNNARISAFIKKICKKYGIKIFSVANVGNHLHLHIQISGNRQVYKAFVRGLTAGIALMVTRASKNKPMQGKFWDYRPFTRLIFSYRHFLNTKDYVQINQFEGLGFSRVFCKILIRGSRTVFSSTA